MDKAGALSRHVQVDSLVVLPGINLSGTRALHETIF